MKSGRVLLRFGWSVSVSLATALAFLLVPVGAHADDVGASFLVRLFNQACVPNLGKPDAVREWAAAHHLTPVASPLALNVFVGPGGKGEAWFVNAPNAQGFALSIRGSTQACAVWARAADPQAVEAAFVKEVEGSARPGLEVKRDNDRTVPSPVGPAKTMSYHVVNSVSHAGFEFTLIVAERLADPFKHQCRSRT